MSTGTRRPWAEGKKSAEAFRALFEGTYVSWEIAGSIRRRKPQVGDAEHVVIPRCDKSGGLFGEMEPIVLLWKRADELLANGTVAKHIYGATGFRWGEFYRGMEFQGMLHEIFTATPASWGNQLVIRTGPAEFSERVVTKLKMGGMYRQKDGFLIHVSSGQVVPVPDEQTYLRLAGMNWIEPDHRR